MCLKAEMFVVKFVHITEFLDSVLHFFFEIIFQLSLGATMVSK